MLALPLVSFSCGQFGNKEKDSKRDMRIVCVSKQLNEMIFALGKGHDIIAVDLSNTYPDSAKLLPTVGYHRMLSAEGIISMKPDLVLHDNDMGTANVLPQLEKAGLNIKAYDIGRTIDSSKLVLKQLANFFGVPKIADSLNQKLDADLLNVKNALVSIHIVDAPSVMVIQLKHLQQFLNERTIIIAVLHDLNLALNYADEILLLNKGKLFSSGKPGDVLSPENINAVFQLEFKLHHFNDVQFLWPMV